MSEYPKSINRLRWQFHFRKIFPSLDHSLARFLRGTVARVIEERYTRNGVKGNCEIGSSLAGWWGYCGRSDNPTGEKNKKETMCYRSVLVECRPSHSLIDGTSLTWTSWSKAENDTEQNPPLLSFRIVGPASETRGSIISTRLVLNWMKVKLKLSPVVRVFLPRQHCCSVASLESFVAVPASPRSFLNGSGNIFTPINTQTLNWNLKILLKIIIKIKIKNTMFPCNIRYELNFAWVEM